ncbi:PREDICTED: huntingtin-interacting protein 1-related protein-like isoform X2 [Nicrophorus vespilloides]|uniref:Huntingtin-interacting protein 1-related protein-like isoform X2 n=1 Tax=Nicrophorus vespilloides TaxID=110193 RepID=A0ABM1N1Q8_NICVS|nr:PREDICTED: huntingtin-interacting protein 1-related protein-like isoform X2 [Nicrophorus vespilloides]
MDEVYSEKEFMKHNVALHKAINKEESPVKQKHVRSAIIGTFSQQGAQVFWSISVRLPCMDDMIVAWKFCYVLHKILREGHPLCLSHSQRHREYLDNIGKLWGHLEDGYGKLIKQYTHILMNKLDFHRKNPRFPGNLNVTTDDLTSICGNNPDICFQMSVEMFDYLDTILDLQKTIFLYKSSSMTMQGQCRLGPIIPCIQDASRIYDHNVKILFLLHSSVPYDVLSGHRDRFMKQFKQLKLFYQHTNMMHYFKNLITVPPLPDKPPNFQDNFNTYVTQEVYVPPEEEEPTTANLIDTADVPDTAPISYLPDNFDIIAERDNIIKNLQEDCERLRVEVNDLYRKGREDKNKMEDHITNLETKLAIKESELTHEKELNELNALSQAQDQEHKEKEERFKNYYMKLREEHISLLREKAKVDKSLKSAEEKMPELVSFNKTVETKLKEAEMKQNEALKELQSVKLEKSDELAGFHREIETLKMEKEAFKKNSSEVDVSLVETRKKLEETKMEKKELDEKINELMSSISKQSVEVIKMKSENDDKLKDFVEKSLDANVACLKCSIVESESPATSALSCTPEYLRASTVPCQEAIESLRGLSLDEPRYLLPAANKLACKFSIFILQGRATSNTSPDISFGEKLTDECKALGESVLNLLEGIKTRSLTDEGLQKSLDHLSSVASLAETMIERIHGNVSENLENMLECEITAMDKAIEEGAKKMQEMLSKSREADSGIKLQVNEKILDSCTMLMLAIRVLVQKSKLLQEEIVQQGKGTATAKEFYKRNHKWTDGFISAAKAIGVAATYLLSSADKVVRGEGKLEQLVVAAHQISASTAQLVVASRVKAHRNSENLKNLSDASKNVTSCTGAIVGTVKDCSELIDEPTELDLSNMTVLQATRSEMEAQVRVLALEKELEEERFKLSALRRHNYQRSGSDEGGSN